jgi:predicted metal-dependent phosphoesterase TrpH
VAAASAAGAANGVAVVAGVELSAVDDRNVEVHILGLHLDDVSRIASSLTRFQADRVTRAEAIVAALNKGGVPITMEAVMTEAGPGAVGRPHVARALVAGGWVRDLREAFDRWLGAERPAYVEKPRLEIADAIRLIHDAGGVAIWAHPFWDISDPAEVLGSIDRFKALGIDGVEAFYVTHDQEQTELLAERCAELGLLSTGSADYHGPENRLFSRFLAFETFGLEPNLGPIDA